MGEQTAVEGPLNPDAGSRNRRLALYTVAWVVGAVPLFAVITALWKAFPTFGSTGDITIGALAIAFPVVVRRLGVPRRESFVRFLLVAGLLFGVVSVLTGWGNGLTDEPFTTPRFVSMLWAHQDPYVVPLVFNYVQYGQTIHSYSIYPYLPLLMFLQVPGIDYKWFALACWVGMVLLVRKRFDAGVLLAQPYVVVMAASGYNDFPVLLLLTVAFVGLWGRRQRWAQLLALGAKQFANAIVVVYYLVRRDWKNALVTIGVSAAFILPFVVWSGPTVLCPTVFANRLASCPSGGAAQYLLNYALWPVWALAVFFPAIVLETRRSARSGRLSRLLAGRTFSVEDLIRIPAFTIVGIAGALAAVSVYLGWGVVLGAATATVWSGALVGAVVLIIWVVACDRAPGAGAPILLPRLGGGRRPVLIHSVAFVLSFAGLGVTLLAGREAIDGVVVGAFLAAIWESLALFRLSAPPEHLPAPPA